MGRGGACVLSFPWASLPSHTTQASCGHQGSLKPHLQGVYLGLSQVPSPETDSRQALPVGTTESPALAWGCPVAVATASAHSCPSLDA